MSNKLERFILKSLYGSDNTRLLNHNWFIFRKFIGSKKFILCGDINDCRFYSKKFLVDYIILENSNSILKDINQIPIITLEEMKKFSNSDAVVLFSKMKSLESAALYMKSIGFTNYYCADLMNKKKYFFNFLKGLKSNTNKFVLKLKLFIKNILYFPYKYFFDKITYSFMKSALCGNSNFIGSSFSQKSKWEDFQKKTKEKKVVIVGICDSFVFLLDSLSNNAIIECGLDWNCYEERRAWGILIKPISHLQELSKRKDVVFLIAACHAPKVNIAVDFLDAYGVQEYFSYSAMECHRFKWKCIRPFYRLLRRQKYILGHNGFFQNEVKFYFIMICCFLRVPLIWEKFKSIESLKNIHKGKRCFIIGTGPSLKIEDVEKLKNEITFGVNRIFRMNENTEWRPTYYSIVDPNAIYDFKRLGYILNLQDLCTEKIIISEPVRKAASDIFNDTNCITVPFSFLDHRIYSGDFKLKYRKNIALGAYNLLSVVNSCINFAHYMGITEIYLLGVDCNYTLSKQYFSGEKSLQGVDLESATVMNHFMQEGFAFMKKIANQYHFNIYNATRGGSLEIFERRDLDQIIG